MAPKWGLGVIVASVAQTQPQLVMYSSPSSWTGDCLTRSTRSTPQAPMSLSLTTASNILLVQPTLRTTTRQAISPYKGAVLNTQRQQLLVYLCYHLPAIPFITKNHGATHNATSCHANNPEAIEKRLSTRGSTPSACGCAAL